MSGRRARDVLEVHNGLVWQLLKEYVMSDEQEGFVTEGVGRARKGFRASHPRPVEMGEMEDGPEWPPKPDGVSFSFTTPHTAETRALLEQASQSVRRKESLPYVTAVWLRGKQGGHVEVLVEMEVVAGDRRWFRAIEDTAGPGLSHCAEAEGAWGWREVLFDDGGLKVGKTYAEILKEVRRL